MSVCTTTAGGPPPRYDQAVLVITALTYAAIIVLALTGHELVAGLIVATWRITARVLRYRGRKRT
ncbi:hypothetical protein ACIA49_28640 [Kribbella sp. NPDC051587]|uniref:hypothetical protein n=1 Tax=Kribbella sp. NPDC051587 TaxID=3364119 RepID=UPI00379BD0EA